MAVMIVGALTALLAGLMAVVASDIKRVLAYSTISQLGYMVYAVGMWCDLCQSIPPAQPRHFQGTIIPGGGCDHHRSWDARPAENGWAGQENAICALGLHDWIASGLVGLPIANGFFSKELILEEGLERRAYCALSRHARGSGDHGSLHAAAELVGIRRPAATAQNPIMMVCRPCEFPWVSWPSAL